MGVRRQGERIKQELSPAIKSSPAMSSLQKSLIFCCIVLASVLIGSCQGQSLSLDRPGHLEPGDRMTSSQARSDMLLLAICWDGDHFLQECLSNKYLLRRILLTVSGRLNGDFPIRKEASSTDKRTQESSQPLPNKRRQERVSRFYGDW